MKKLLLLLSVVVFTGQMNAQSNLYHPLPDSNAIWSIQYVQGCTGSPTTSYYQYTIGGDTVIGIYTYKKILKSGSVVGCYSSGVTNFNNFYQGGLRQDTANKKVYFICFGYSAEYLLYDFSKHAGDTLHILDCQGYNNGTAIINSIDSVLVGTNYHKRFNTSGFGNLIEGVGGTTGLLEPIVVFEDYSDLLCFHHKTEFYPTTASGCNTLNITQFAKTISHIEIYPNPTSDQFYIETTATDKLNVDLYDVNGRHMFSANVGDEEIINVSSLDNGIYSVVIKTADFKINKKLAIVR